MYYQSSVAPCLIISLASVKDFFSVRRLRHFNCTGTSVSLFTTSIGSASRNYTVQCVVDGTPVVATPELSNLGPNHPICQAFDLPADILHTISLSILVPPKEEDKLDQLSGFCFDYILIDPAPSMSLEDYNLFLSIIDIDFPSFAFSSNLSFDIASTALHEASGSSGWSFNKLYGLQTTNTGSHFNLSFTGTDPKPHFLFCCEIDTHV